MKKGYLIFDIEVTDKVAYEHYRTQAQPVLANHPGHFIVRKGKTEILEGDWEPESFFILEFPSYEHAREFYFSEEYQKVLPLRLRSSISKALIIEGE